MDHACLSLDAFKKKFEENAKFERMALHACETVDALALLDAPRVKLMKLVGGIIGEGSNVSFTPDSIDITFKNNKPAPLDSLALGEINAILMLVAAMSAWEGALLIDYPEISLHTDFQGVLIKLIRTLNPDAQIIMATHSAAILDRLDWDMSMEVSAEGKVV